MGQKAIDEEFKDQYNFLYLPHDFEKGSALPYAFVNFISEDIAASFAEKWKDRVMSHSKKCEICNATAQGLKACLGRFTSNSGTNSHAVNDQPAFQQPIMRKGGCWQLLDGDHDIEKAWESKSSSSHGADVEKRIPEDGKAYTLEEMKALWSETYSDAEIREYWEKNAIQHQAHQSELRQRD